MVQSTLSPGQRLRQAWTHPPLILPGVFDPLVARLAASLGFSAVYLSGGALSASMGVPDVGLLGLAEFVERAAAITRVCTLPLLCDADTGFGTGIHVERCVQMFEQAGTAGIHLEDQEMPKRCGHLSGKALVDTATMVGKIQAAVAARQDAAFVIIARTDARGVTSLDDAIARANAYRTAGADVIFPEALASVAEFATFAQEVSGPLLANMTEFGKSPLLDRAELRQLGYQMILYPLTAYRLALAATRHALQQLRDQPTQTSLLPDMLTRSELYDLLGYADYEARDRAYFDPPSS